MKKLFALIALSGAVALPAVLAYNLLGRSASTLEALLEGFAHDLQAQFALNAT